MFCEKCGSKITNENAAFCISCGARVNVPIVQKKAIPTEPDTKDPEILKRRKVVSVLGLIGMIMGIIGWFFLSFIILFFVDFVPNEILDMDIDKEITDAISLIVSLSATMLISLLAVVYGNGLNSIGQLKGKCVRGRRRGRAGFWISAAWLTVCILVLIPA